MTHRNVYIKGRLSDITVVDGKIASIVPATPREGETLFLAIPGIANMHTHSAMTLLRSAGSGLPLFRWLSEAILPAEALLTPDDIRRGAGEACEEMLATGTTAFNDMYFSIESTIRAAEEYGMDANIAISVTDGDFDDPSTIAKHLQTIEDMQQRTFRTHITTSIAPHSIYTVSGKHLQYLADFAKEHGTIMHMHISETLREREECLREHGMPPVRYLERLGVLDKSGERFIGAHALWLDGDEIAILGSHHASVVHCPNSNLKLGSGCRFLYTELRDAGVNVTLGTDGCASSDNLDMVEAMKVMSLLQKGTRNDPSALPSDEVLAVATANGRKALGLPSNEIETGNIADFALISLNNRCFNNMDLADATPADIHSRLLDRLIYASHGESVASVHTHHSTATA